ncbi:hypothetical protein GF412_05310 [Candidatus Micrarchaeota archaeon]|nr:hypothetical protein [Candidatus Micrarchaeota archaeon]MBD3418371.1 hypothetical protein [Candidatus Micrarchaeota archaeon]
MKIAVIGDTHLGYPRFYTDSFTQARAAFKDADQKADLILFLGDLYDSRVPSLQVLGEAISLFRELKTQVYAIHGNHERRSRGALNPVELLAKAGLLTHLHMDSATFEKDGEKIFIAGMGNVPDDLTPRALEKLRQTVTPPADAFSILLLHQSFKEFVYGENLSSIHDLEPLNYSLYMNGHIHAHKTGMDGKFLIPGSTVLTQLTKEETKPKGYLLYDTNSNSYEFVEIPSRKFILREIEMHNAAPNEAKKQIEEELQELKAPDAVIKLKIKGTLAHGFKASDLNLPQEEGVFIDNHLNERRLKKEIEKLRELRENKLSMRELSEQRLRERLQGKVGLFDPQKLFEHLLEGPDAGMQYLKTKRP